MNSLSYLIVVFGIFFAKLVGFSRDLFFANFYGTGVKADIYFQIFGLVTLFFSGIGIALSTIVIMNLNKEENASEEKRRVYVSSFLCRSTAYLAAATAVLYLLARPLTKILLPNIDSAYFELAVRLVYIMLPSFLFVSVAYILSGILQNSKVFFIPSIMSLPYNLIIIAALFLPNVTIEQIGVATTIGWFSHILIQLPSFYRKGYRFFYRPKDPALKAQAKPALSVWWIFASNMMFQLCYIIDKAAVSGNEGMTATLNYASNLFVTISSVFVVAMSSVVFPSVSKNYEEGKIDYVRELIGYILIVMFTVFVPFLLVVTLFGEQIIGLLYERGEFTHDSTVATAAAFAIYSFGILGYVAQELINKVLYLAEKYRWTVLGTVAVVAAKLAIDVYLVPLYGTTFAAVSTTLLLTAYAAVAFTLLRSIIGRYLTPYVLKNIGKVLLAGACASAVYLVFRFAAYEKLVMGKIAFLVPLAACAIVYVAVAFLTGLPKVLISGAKPKTEPEE